MPSRNIIKQFDVHSYYHVYNRGVGGQQIYREAADKQQFLKIIARHLDSSDAATKNDGTAYRKFASDLELLCYCLMGNHFHLLFYQAEDQRALTEFMRSILTAYTMYFNRKYKRAGPLFQSVYKSSKISSDSYLTHISRYIHLNPRTYKTYFYSSLSAYLGKQHPVWLQPEKVLTLFKDSDYMSFLEDYEDHKTMLESLKYELADTR